jgi:adenine-specific DNA-methyltransferase
MDEEAAPITWWDKGEYASANYGAAELKDLFGEKNFDFPKARKLVEDALRACGAARNNTTVIDFFGGSGTTAHAVIAIARDTKEKHKYVIVEQGEYFDTVLKPRIQKVVYSADWKDAKATAPQTGISHAFKVLKLESYEDTLNNLQLRRTAQQQSLIDILPQSAKDDYLLRYLLDIESRGSLLSVEHFNKPFHCKLKVTVDSAGAYEERTIDLVETFNYLIGLRVSHIDMRMEKGFVWVAGCLPTGEKTLVLWRDVEQVDYETLTRLCDKLKINPADSEFELVYINGDHNIPAVFTSTEAEGSITKTLKIRQIEPEFLSRMFSVEDV